MDPRPPMTTAAAIELACQMALGDDTSHDRFRFAWDAAQTELGTLSGFAKRLGVHPSSLTRTNFKLSPVRRQVAAELLGVSAGFLAAGAVTQENLPAVLHAPYRVATAILALAKCPGQSKSVTWTPEATLIDLKPATLHAKLPALDRSLVAAVHHTLADYASQRLKRDTSVTLPLADWAAIVDLLVADSLAQAPENLQHRGLQLARRLHRGLSEGNSR